MRTERGARAGAVERAAAVPLLLLALAVPGQLGGETRERTVGPGGDHATIAAALAAAGDGDRIVIRAGLYRESPIVVDRTVSLVGEGWPVLDGEGKHAVVVVNAPGVEVRGLVIRGAGVSHLSDNAAILFEGVGDCTVEGNRLEENFFGIYLARSTGCTISGNTIRAAGTREATSGNGIHIWNGGEVLIRGNRIAGHRDGIYLEFAAGTTIVDNTSEDNLRYGLHFMFSNRTVFARNSFRRNGAGVAVMYSNEVEIAENRFEDNWGSASYGLLLKEITDSEVRGNVFRRNTVGVYSEGSSRIAVLGNRFARNGWAVTVMTNSRENRFSGNDFIANSFDVTTNGRQNFNVFDGNHWGRYQGYDLTGDGVGDVPHRPVRLFSLIVQRNPAALTLLGSLFVDLMDVAERVLPLLTPATLVDENPRVRAIGGAP